MKANIFNKNNKDINKSKDQHLLVIRLKDFKEINGLKNSKKYKKNKNNNKKSNNFKKRCLLKRD